MVVPVCTKLPPNQVTVLLSCFAYNYFANLFLLAKKDSKKIFTIACHLRISENQVTVLLSCFAYNYFVNLFLLAKKDSKKIFTIACHLRVSDSCIVCDLILLQVSPSYAEIALKVEWLYLLSGHKPRSFLLTNNTMCVYSISHTGSMCIAQALP